MQDREIMNPSKINLDQAMLIILISKNMELEITGAGEDNLLEKQLQELRQEQLQKKYYKKIWEKNLKSLVQSLN